MKLFLSRVRWYGSVTICILLLSAVTMTVFQPRLALAERSPDSPIVYATKQRWGSRRYDINAVETVTGTVTSIDRVSTGTQMGGIHVMLKTVDEQLSVHLGPAWYLDEQPLQIAVNDTLEVTGSRVVFDQVPGLIAAEVRRGDAVMVLRDRNGLPQWRSQGPCCTR